MKKISLILLLLLTAHICPAQKTSVPDKTRVLLILDCSHSMWNTWQSDTKIKVTQKVLLQLLDSLQKQPHTEVALRVFGHLNKDAYSTRLEVPFEAGNSYKLQSKIKTLVPNGGCTAATALTNALKDFPSNDNARNFILIVTDGMDDCDGNICEVARQVQQSNLVVKTFIVGIGDSSDFHHQPDCAGRFTFIANEERLHDALGDVFRISDQKAQVTLALYDDNHHLYETEVPLAFYDHQSHQVKYTTIYHYDTEHTPDTLSVDPLADYDITFFTKPPLQLSNYQFQAGHCNHVEIAVPQGSLCVRQDNKRTSFEVPIYNYTVRHHDKGELLTYQPLGAKANYLAGTYDIEILSTPPLLLPNIEVRSGSATDLKIALPGQLALNKPKVATTGDVFAYHDGQLQWVCQLNPGTLTERLVLQPGDYQVVLKPQKATTYAEVRTARFTIRSAQQTSVNLE